MTMNNNRAIKALALSLAVLALPLGAAQAEIFQKLPVATAQPAAAKGLQTAVVAGGCFWGVQGVFAHVKGVTKVVSGYAGGTAPTAKYEVVSTGATKHAEAVQITFDPAQISYAEILRIFFSVATDPTEVNRQGPDVGPQYRNEIFYTNADQQRVAAAYIAQLDAGKAFPKKIATKVSPLPKFYAAEKHHQDYLTLNPTQPYIVYNDLPKVAALKQYFPERYRADPVLVSKTGV
jgi:peptide-methionine (S)-S-oxide reductase